MNENIEKAKELAGKGKDGKVVNYPLFVKELDGVWLIDLRGLSSGVVAAERKNRTYEMKKLLLVAMACGMKFMSYASGVDVMDINGAWWRYYISNEKAVVMGCTPYLDGYNCILPAYIRGYPVSSFYNDTFFNCAFTNIVIPANFTGDLNGGLLGGQRGKLSSVTVAAGNGKYSSLDGLLYNKNQTSLIYVPPCASFTCIPNAVTNICKSALISCDHATAQWIKASVCLQSSNEREDWMQKNKMFINHADGNISAAFRLRSGKVDGAGRQMSVWEDYVAGTNPTETNDVFRAAIAIERGEVKVSWSPKLPPSEAAKRIYTI